MNFVDIPIIISQSGGRKTIMYDTTDVYGKNHDTKKEAERLAAQYDFNIVEAKKEGYSYSDILSHLVLKQNLQDAYLDIVMCPPKYLSTKISNNKWMKDMSDEDREVNIDKAMGQFFNLYGLIAQDAMVYLLPPKPGLQDQVYVSNAGIVLPHLYKTIILSNFTAPGRPGEEKCLSQFVDLMDFSQHLCPHKFEGEADMKWIRDNIYICGYGIRSDIKAFQWMEKEFGCHCIYFKEFDELRYHLDCSVFPINRECVLLSTDGVPAATIKEIEAVAEIIPISKKDSQYSLTNCVRVGSIIYNGTNISELKRSDKDYEAERHKNESLEKICDDMSLSLMWVNLSEFGASGAALSCEILHLSRIAYPA
jgi:N-dimethylarginine dimethylaminohydrolase